MTRTRWEFRALIIVEGEQSASEAEDEAVALTNEVNKGDGPHVFLTGEPPERDEVFVE